MSITSVRKRPTTKRVKETTSTIVSRLLGEYSLDCVRAGLIEQWASAHAISSSQLLQCETCSQFSAGAERKDVAEIRIMLKELNWKPALKDLEHGFETLNDANHRRNQGIVYTPDWIIDYLVNHAVDSVKSAPPKICDPACGSGGFLVRSAKQLSHRFGIDLRQAISEYIVGFDRDETAVAHSRCLLELLLATRQQHLQADQFQLFCVDTLLDDPTQLWKRTGVDCGFDIVTTNPPYVKLQNLPTTYRQTLVNRYGEFIKGSYSLALLFLLSGYRMLAPGGCLAYVTQNNFFTSLAGEPLRRYLQDQQCIKRIVDFGHAHVFENASAYTCLIFLSNNPQPSFQFGRVPEPPTADKLTRQTFSDLSVDRLQSKKWRLASRRHLDNLDRIERTGAPLGKLATINVGFATLRDSVFLVRDKGNYCSASTPSGQSAMIEREITQPAVKIAELNNEDDLRDIETRVIYPYRKTNGRVQKIDEDKLQRDFPLAYEYLKGCRPQLDLRDKGKANPDGWYAWGRAQGREAPGPKLLTKTFDREPRFLLDTSDQLFCNGYAVSLPASNTPLTIGVLQRILNSSIMHYYAKLTSFQIEGGFQCYQKNFIQSFGIPKLTKANCDQISRATRPEVDSLLSSIYGIAFDDVREIL